MSCWFSAQITDLSAEQEVLILRHYVGEQGFSRTEAVENEEDCGAGLGDG